MQQAVSLLEKKAIQEQMNTTHTDTQNQADINNTRPACKSCCISKHIYLLLHVLSFPWDGDSKLWFTPNGNSNFLPQPLYFSCNLVLPPFFYLKV